MINTLGKCLFFPPFTVEFTASEVKRTSNMETYLHGLLKATNYSIRVLAFTSTGDGLHSIPVYCSTDEDVPEAPANIKASALTAESILISWLPPTQRNGLITHYTVYSKDSGRKGQTRSEWNEIIFRSAKPHCLCQTSGWAHKFSSLN